MGVLVPLVFLAASVDADTIELPTSLPAFTEDLAEVAGFAAWLAFWASFAAARVRDAAARA